MEYQFRAMIYDTFTKVSPLPERKCCSGCIKNVNNFPLNERKQQKINNKSNFEHFFTFRVGN